MDARNPKRAKQDGLRAAPSDHTDAGSRIMPDDIKPCLWMEAGLLTWWMCDRDLQCTSCPLDAALRHKSLEARASSRAEPKNASAPAPTSAPDGSPALPPAWTTLVDRALAPLDARARYAPSHVWVREEDLGAVRLGLDPFVSWVVGRLRCVVLLPAGMRVNRGEPCAWLDQPGGTLTVTSPISGEIVECNTAMTTRGDLTLADPFGADWLLLVRPWRLRTESRRLMPVTQFEGVVHEHSVSWRRLLRRALRSGVSRAGPTLADGGRAISGLDELLGARRHHRIAAGYLRASH